MGWFDHHEDDYDQFHNQGSLTQDAVAGAASYEAAKLYEDHCAKNGRPDSHAKSKELLAGFAGAAVDRFAMTKGRDMWDEHQQNQYRQQAQQQVSNSYDQSFNQSSDTYSSDQTYTSDQTSCSDQYSSGGQGYGNQSSSNNQSYNSQTTVTDSYQSDSYGGNSGGGNYGGGNSYGGSY